MGSNCCVVLVEEVGGVKKKWMVGKEGEGGEEGLERYILPNRHAYSGVTPDFFLNYLKCCRG